MTSLEKCRFWKKKDWQNYWYFIHLVTTYDGNKRTIQQYQLNVHWNIMLFLRWDFKLNGIITKYYLYFIWENQRNWNWYIWSRDIISFSMCMNTIYLGCCTTSTMFTNVNKDCKERKDIRKKPVFIIRRIEKQFHNEFLRFYALQWSQSWTFR